MGNTVTPQHVQWTLPMKTLNHLLSAGVWIIVCINLGSTEKCPPDQIFHFNPTTNIGVCCIPRDLPEGYGFKSCKVDGTLDTIEKCPVGYHQPDNTGTESEATCVRDPQCNGEDNVKAVICDTSGQNCVNTCVCNYEGGYCGKEFYNCERFPRDCPSELVQRDCSCQRVPPSVRPLPENASNKPDQMITTTSSTASGNGGSKAPQESNATNIDGDLDNSNGTANNNRTENSVPDHTENSVPDHTESTILTPVIIISVILGVGVVAAVVVVFIFRRSMKEWLWRLNSRNSCCWNRSAKQNQDSLSLVVVLPSDPVVSGQSVSREQSTEEAQPFLSRDESDHGAPNNPAGYENDDDSIQIGGANMQSLVVDTARSKGCHGDQNNPAGDQGEDDIIQADGSNTQSLVLGHARSKGCRGDQNNPAGDQGEGDSIQADGSNIQSLVVEHDRSKGCYGDQNNPAGDQGEGDSIQADGSNIQSLVVEHGKTRSQGIDSAGPFCHCCDRHYKRCNKLVKKQRLARVHPQQEVNGTRETSEYPELPSIGNGENEWSVPGYSSFSSSIHHPEPHDRTDEPHDVTDESHDSTDEETARLKPVGSCEVTCSDDHQISSIVQRSNDVESPRFEKSPQTELDNENPIPICVISNNEEENDEDAEEI